jgi:hypothetical protein
MPSEISVKKSTIVMCLLALTVVITMVFAPYKSLYVYAPNILLSDEKSDGHNHPVFLRVNEVLSTNLSERISKSEFKALDFIDIAVIYTEQQNSEERDPDPGYAYVKAQDGKIYSSEFFHPDLSTWVIKRDSLDPARWKVYTDGSEYAKYPTNRKVNESLEDAYYGTKKAIVPYLARLKWGSTQNGKFADVGSQ